MATQQCTDTVASRQEHSWAEPPGTLGPFCVLHVHSVLAWLPPIVQTNASQVKWIPKLAIGVKWECVVVSLDGLVTGCTLPLTHSYEKGYTTSPFEWSVDVLCSCVYITMQYKLGICSFLIVFQTNLQWRLSTVFTLVLWLAQAVQSNRGHLLSHVLL